MKHVYILNYWWQNQNYGAILTAYALNKLISNSILVEDIENPLYQLIHRNQTFSFSFKKKHMKTRQLYGSYNNLCKLNDDSNIFIVGSDQVFRFGTNFGERFYQYSLDFVNLNAKKIAFSASFGFDRTGVLKECNEEILLRAKNALKSFDFISVREKSGVEICRDVLGVDAEWIIDPVFILEKSNWNELIKNSPQNYSDKIVSYVLDTDEKYKKAYKYLLKKYGGEVVETAGSNISVESWLKSIRDCKLFVTDSFHGMCFAIIFNKPFICISNKSRGAARFESICEMLGIENQCINSIDEIYEKDCVFKVDWDGVNRRIEEERRRGLEFLKKALDTPLQITPEKINSRYNYLERRVSELESQANLKYQIKKELWNLWLVIWHKYLPNPIKCIIRKLRGKK